MMNHHCRHHEISVEVPVVSRNGWAVVYAGFIIMLLCFFILLCAYSVTDTSKVSQAVRSFSTAVALPTTEHSATGRGGDIASPKEGRIAGTDSHIDELYHSIEKMATELGMGNDIHASLSGKGMLLQLSNSILFAPGRATVLPDGQKLIAHVGDMMVSHPMYNLRIEGHTDNTPIHTAQYPSNWELSTLRAVNVLRCLTDRRSIDAGRLSAVGFGEYTPRFPNDTPENKAKNRRVELFFFRNDIKKVVQ